MDYENSKESCIESIIAAFETHQRNCLSLCFRNFKFDFRYHPTIAQLAERETVEAKQLSLGHWFESGWTETFFQIQNALPSSP